MSCEGCTSTTVKGIPENVVTQIEYKQIELKQTLKRKPTIPETIKIILREWANSRSEPK